MKKTILVGALAMAFGFSTAAASTALACDGEHQKGHDPQARFQRADKNGDGFLTKDEVGEKRWQRIQVADANKDQKVSMDELKQAHKDGKLGRPGHGPKA